MLVKELQLLDDIEAIAEAYETKYGLPPCNISNWDPSKDSIELNLHATLPPIAGDGKNYIFSYTVSDQSGLRLALNYANDQWRSLISHSGSASIVVICNWLRAMGSKNILILGPRYFTVPHCLNAMGIGFETKHCKRTKDGYVLPDIFEEDDFDGIWVTNPIYGTGVYFSDNELTSLQQHWTSKNKFFVLDECLATFDRYIGPKLQPHPKTTIVAAPHKSICVNAYKFAISVFEKSQLEHFEHWSDVWLGCLPQSSHQAIEHFRGGGFLNYQSQFYDFISSSNIEFLNLTNFFSEADVDKNAFGYFRSVYFKDLSSDLGADKEFLRTAFFDTGAMFIPGNRNELDPNAGLSFRVNLAAFDTEARGAYLRLLHWLASKC